jgi:hypothetical protein
MVAHPWVFRCPNGHASARHFRTKGESGCRHCEFRWRGGLFDAREVEFPVPESEYEVVG